MNSNRSAVLVLATLLASCAAPSINRVDADNTLRAGLTLKAAAGDPEAQYQLGVSYCCGTGFYSTSEAIAWWCKSAAQNHPLAIEKLREHLGDRDRKEACRPQE